MGHIVLMESAEQIAIRRTVNCPYIRHVLVRAAAGSGKSTTIYIVLDEINLALYRALVLSFNRSIKLKNESYIKNNEYLGEYANHINARTLHGLALLLCDEHGIVDKNHFEDDNKWDEHKYVKYVNSHIEELAGMTVKEMGKHKAEHYARNIIELIDLARIRCADKIGRIQALIEEYDIKQVHNEPEAVLKAIRWGVEHLDKVDMTDFLYIAYNQNLTPKYKYDYILVDEFQDISPLQRDLIIRYMKPQTSIYAFGDENQNINIWVGVEKDAIDSFKKELKRKFRAQGVFTELPLSGSYRCAPAIIREAKKVKPDAEIYSMRTDGIEGTINENVEIQEIQEGAAVLGRYKYQIMKVYMDCVRDGKKCIISGRHNQEGRQLIELVEKAVDYDNLEFSLEKPGVFSVLYGSLFMWIKEKMNSGNIDYKTALDDDDIVEMYDNILTLEVLSDGVTTKEELIAKIESINYVDAKTADELEREKDSIMFSTIHKAKGCEYDTVFIIDKDLLGAKNPRVRGESRRTEEINLHYVAITRAKNTINYLAFDKSSNGFKDRMNMKKMEDTLEIMEQKVAELHPGYIIIDKRSIITKNLEGDLVD